MNSDPSSIPSNWATELRDLVNRSFDTNEMHELAFDFNLDFDDIPGRGKSGKIVELLQILARQQRIPEFIERCQSLRPRENWQPLLDTARSEPLSFHVEYGAVSETAASPTSSLLRNRNLFFGIAALALILVVVAVAMTLNQRNSRSNFNGDEGLRMKLETLFSGVQAQTPLYFDPELPGWNAISGQAFVADGTAQLESQSILVRDKTFGPGQGILIDFFMSDVNPNDPAVTFSLQNAQNPENATRVIALNVLNQPESVAIENGEAVTADQFARNTTLAADTDYTVVMGFDANGRFLASLFGFSTTTDEDANFVHLEPEDWADETWWFHIETGDQSSVTLLGGWEIAFDGVKQP